MVNNRILRRLEKLESGLISAPIVLHLADGSTRQIYYSDDGLLDLLMAALSHEVENPVIRKHLEWVGGTVSYKDPGGGLMIELIQQALKTDKAEIRRPAECLRPPEMGPAPAPPSDSFASSSR